jgi:hypothetical protein
MAPPRRLLAHGRGLLVALHVVAITLMAMPAPGEGMFREAWKDPTVQGEFAAWSGRLNQFGIAVTPEEFEDHLWDVAVRYTRLRDAVLAPFQEYYSTCGTLQSWRMFAGPQRYPIRLSIEVREGDAWRIVYRQRDPAHSWLAEELDQYRFRPVLYRFGWYRYAGENEDLNGFARWIGRQVSRDFPSARAVRVRLYQQQTPTPEQTRAGAVPEGEYVKDVTVNLPYRPQ